jgi:uncharacterized ferritin-like protein (DUF455 family)
MTPSLRRTALQLIVLDDPHAKAHAVRGLPADLGALTAAGWMLDPHETLDEPPGLPGRAQRPALLPARELPQRSLATPEGRAALVHSLAHIECNAVDLALDALWRFSGMPPAFYGDWLRVAREEALHFQLLAAHLQSLGWAYGDFAAHEGLWFMARKTQGDLLARMAIVPRTLEARGLDASPAVKRKLLGMGDTQGAAIVDLILRDEIGHVAIGNHWFRWLCSARGLEPVEQYRVLAREYGAPRLNGPFNLEARRAAGFEEAELAELGR